MWPVQRLKRKVTVIWVEKAIANKLQHVALLSVRVTANWTLIKASSLLYCRHVWTLRLPWYSPKMGNFSYILFIEFRRVLLELVFLSPSSLKTIKRAHLWVIRDGGNSSSSPKAAPINNAKPFSDRDVWHTLTKLCSNASLYENNTRWYG